MTRRLVLLMSLSWWLVINFNTHIKTNTHTHWAWLTHSRKPACSRTHKVDNNNNNKNKTATNKNKQKSTKSNNKKRGVMQCNCVNFSKRRFVMKRTEKRRKRKHSRHETISFDEVGPGHLSASSMSLSRYYLPGVQCQRTRDIRRWLSRRSASIVNRPDDKTVRNTN